MRLGDLDALKETIHRQHYRLSNVINTTDHGMFTVGIDQAIDEQPTIDPVPALRGHWIKTEQENGCAMWTDFKCSVCGSVFDGNENLFSEWKGCPVCLTRMDGE
jgi:hypothetical protein